MVQKTVAAAAWFTPGTYVRIREIGADKDRLPETFEDWKKRFESQLRAVEARGIAVAKIELDPDALLVWADGAPIDSKKRSEFAAFLLAQKNEGRQRTN